MTNVELGLVLARGTAPEAVPKLAAAAESAGMTQVWIAEDGFSTGVTTVAALALAATSRIRVGLGVASALVRHPAVLASDISSIARTFPGRFTAGIGLGVPDWLRQMGLGTRHQLAAVRGCVTSIRDLLAGKTLDERRTPFVFNDVALTYPPEHPVPLHIGGTGPRMLELSGEIADGTLLSVGASERYIRWAIGHIATGQRVGLSRQEHELTSISIYSVNNDGAAARQAAKSTLAGHLYHGGPGALTSVYGISDAIADLRQSGGLEGFEARIPPRWIEDLTVAGDPAECAAAISSLSRAGVDAVALLPADGLDPEELLQLTRDEVLPRL